MLAVSPVERLQTRFAARLNGALDAAGYSRSRATRAKELGATVGLDPQVTAGWLGGHLLPTWAEFLVLCDRLRRSAGYFLDEQESELPPGVVTVPCLGVGEPLAVRLPSEVLSDKQLRRGLNYYLAPESMGFGVAPGDYVIAFSPVEGHAEVGKLYLIEVQKGYDVRRCTEVIGGRAVFHADEAFDVPLIRAMSANAEEPTFAEIACVLRLSHNIKNQQEKMAGLC